MEPTLLILAAVGLALWRSKRSKDAASGAPASSPDRVGAGEDEPPYLAFDRDDDGVDDEWHIGPPLREVTFDEYREHVLGLGGDPDSGALVDE